MMELWQAIQMLEGQTLRTLAQGERFDVLDVGTNAVIIRPHKTRKERSIPRKELESAYTELLALGHISCTQIGARHSLRNPVYVAAFLAQVEGIAYTTRPIILKVKRGERV
jgi:hypothetical protein